MRPITRRVFLTLAAVCAPALRIRAAEVTLDEFMELSERLLERTHLDRANGRLYLDALNADPDDAVTLAYLVQSNGNPTPEQRALAATIIEWWRSGVYVHRGERRVTTPLTGNCASA
jgi:hypothetical protein